MHVTFRYRILREPLINIRSNFLACSLSQIKSYIVFNKRYFLNKCWYFYFVNLCCFLNAFYGLNNFRHWHLFLSKTCHPPFLDYFINPSQFNNTLPHIYSPCLLIMKKFRNDILCCIIIVSDLGQLINCLLHLFLVIQCQKLLHDDFHFFKLFPLNFVEFKEVPLEI